MNFSRKNFRQLKARTAHITTLMRIILMTRISGLSALKKLSNMLIDAWTNCWRVARMKSLSRDGVALQHAPA